jgi:hypothetical protein
MCKYKDCVQVVFLLLPHFKNSPKIDLEADKRKIFDFRFKTLISLNQGQGSVFKLLHEKITQIPFFYTACNFSGSQVLTSDAAQFYKKQHFYHSPQICEFWSR